MSFLVLQNLGFLLWLLLCGQNHCHLEFALLEGMLLYLRRSSEGGINKLQGFLHEKNVKLTFKIASPKRDHLPTSALSKPFKKATF